MVIDGNEALLVWITASLDESPLHGPDGLTPAGAGCPDAHKNQVHRTKEPFETQGRRATHLVCGALDLKGLAHRF